MAKPNYAFEKRQRELAKKKKKEEKAQRKTGPGHEGEAQAADMPAGSTAPDGAASATDVPPSGSPLAGA